MGWGRGSQRLCYVAATGVHRKDGTRSRSAAGTCEGREGTPMRVYVKHCGRMGVSSSLNTGPSENDENGVVQRPEIQYFPIRPWPPALSRRDFEMRGGSGITTYPATTASVLVDRAISRLILGGAGPPNSLAISRF